METTHSTPPPGPIGRFARIAVGLLLGAYAALLVLEWMGALQTNIAVAQPVYTHFVQKENVGLYIVALLAVLWLPVLHRRGRLVTAAIFTGSAVGLDYLTGGRWWGLPLAAFLSLLVFAMLAFFAVAHVLAGLTANPG